MTDTEITANLYALERRIYQLEQDMKHIAKVGDLVEVEWHLYGDVYQRRDVVVKGITHSDVYQRSDVVVKSHREAEGSEDEDSN